MMKNYITEPTLFGHDEVIGFGDENFFVKEIPRNDANKIIIKNHYSKKFYNASYIHLGIFMNNELIGVLQYGYAMNPSSQASVVKNTEIKEYLELNRMWLDDKAPRNSESKAISYSIKYIKRKYPKVKWIQSFADERCGCFGIVYQAANFKYYGKHEAIFWTLDGETFHNSIKTSRVAGPRGYDLLNSPENIGRITSEILRQFRYIYFIDKRCIKDCLLTEKPYEKHYK
jgi:adenine modification enzyme